MFEADTTTGRECFTLSITDDDIFEDAELFRVILQPTDDPTINLVTSVLTITIIDDDSKSLVQTNPPLFFKTQVLYVPPPQVYQSHLQSLHTQWKSKSWSLMCVLHLMVLLKLMLLFY